MTAVESTTELILWYEDRLQRLRLALLDAHHAVCGEQWDTFNEIVTTAFKYEHEQDPRAVTLK